MTTITRHTKIFDTAEQKSCHICYFTYGILWYEMEHSVPNYSENADITFYNEFKKLVHVDFTSLLSIRYT
jgi:hypothetical protein